MTDLSQWLNKIHHIDALELLSQLPDASIDMVLTDPPYGIGMSKAVGLYSKSVAKQKRYDDSWDNITPDKRVFDEILRVSQNALIFGGNYFSDKLPQSNHWIVWDKVIYMPSYSKCELIWSNFDYNTVQKITREMNGMLGGIPDRVHPTQKPVDLIEQLITTYTEPDAIICDPFAGSGTTAIACTKTGRNFICGDNHAPYVEIARKRLQDADPFQPTKLADGSTQLSLFGGKSQ